MAGSSLDLCSVEDRISVSQQAAQFFVAYAAEDDTDTDVGKCLVASWQTLIFSALHCNYCFSHLLKGVIMADDK